MNLLEWGIDPGIGELIVGLLTLVGVGGLVHMILWARRVNRRLNRLAKETPTRFPEADIFKSIIGKKAETFFEREDAIELIKELLRLTMPYSLGGQILYRCAVKLVTASGVREVISLYEISMDKARGEVESRFDGLSASLSNILIFGVAGTAYGLMVFTLGLDPKDPETINMWMVGVAVISSVFGYLIKIVLGGKINQELVSVQHILDKWSLDIK